MANQSQTPCQWTGQNGWPAVSPSGPHNPMPSLQHLNLGSQYPEHQQWTNQTNMGFSSNVNHTVHHTDTNGPLSIPGVNKVGNAPPCFLPVVTTETQLQQMSPHYPKRPDQAIPPSPQPLYSQQGSLHGNLQITPQSFENYGGQYPQHHHGNLMDSSGSPTGTVQLQPQCVLPPQLRGRFTCNSSFISINC